MTTDRRPMATPEEVAEYLVVSVKTIYDWRLKRIGPKAYKVGNHLRYRWAEVDKWVDEQSEDAVADFIAKRRGTAA